jgi:hypothetical protein
MNRFVVVYQSLRCPTKKLTAVIKSFTDAGCGFNVSNYNRRVTDGCLIYHTLPVVMPDLSGTGKDNINGFAIGYQDTAWQALCRFTSITWSFAGTN